MERPSNTLHTQMSSLISEVLNFTAQVHSLHLRVTGEGSFAQHKALNDTYDALPGIIDNIAEGWQGYNEKLIQPLDTKSPVFSSTKDIISYLRTLHNKITQIQSALPTPASEIVNDLDMLKSLINSLKYKLLFLS